MQLPTYSGSHPAQEEAFFVEQIAEMRRRLEAVRDLPGLEEFRSTRRMPAEFFEDFNAALACFDRIIDFVLSYDGTDRGIKCSKGCCNCCIDLVRGINTPEIVNIYRHVRGWPDARRIFEYFRESAEIFMNILGSKMGAGEKSIVGDDPRIEEAHREYNLKNRPCGFLDHETGSCRIYVVRPIACRYFFSMDPPEMCTPLSPRYFSRDTRTVHLPPEIHELLMQIGQRLGFRPLNYLSGAFCGFAAEVMQTRAIEVV